MKITYKGSPYADLHPSLREALDIIHAKRPLLEYQVEAFASMSKDATRVQVYQHGQNLGFIDALYKRYSASKGENITMFRVRSPLIHKSRGQDRHSKMFKHAKDAAKCVIEVFAKKPLTDLGTELVEEVSGAVNYCTYSIENNFSRSWTFDTSELLSYILRKTSGESVDVPSKLSAQVTDDMHKKHDEFLTAQNVRNHMRAKNGYAIKMMQDETYLVANFGNLEDTNKYNSTYEMPQFLQEKLTILKVLDMDQCAADIGVRLEDSGTKAITYFVVGGDTIVN